MPSLVAGIMLAYNLIILVYLAYEAISRMVSESPSHSTDPVAALSLTNGSFLSKLGPALLENQGWAGSNESFVHFHTSQPKHCQSYITKEPSTIPDHEEAYYVVDTEAKQLGRVTCPARHICLIVATFDKGWKLSEFTYSSLSHRYPIQLEEHMAQLSSQMDYFLLVQGSANGTLVFSTILYHTNNGANNTSPKDFNQAKYCQVTLGSGAPDGILSFIPKKVDTDGDGIPS
ncbi:hypothetical protein DSO57_1032505 [Entomophthora muscae]|uniref:Uncharacterized protein n=1 Tax=Entomophthora muscae TaxID=34485 RepID=A0ACC2RR92_9FUNG|nr:hypothetical protein DSO57_1032505 [Entomophthora muscae]